MDSESRSEIPHASSSSQGESIPSSSTQAKNDSIAMPQEPEEITSTDELSSTIEIDVVGDLPPRKISITCADSGVEADMSSTASSSAQNDDVPAVHDNQDASSRRSSLARPQVSPRNSAQDNLYITPNRFYPKPLLTSTPFDNIFLPWLPPMGLMPQYPPNPMYLKNFGIPAQYPAPRPILPQIAQGILPKDFPHHAFGSYPQHLSIPGTRDARFPSPHPFVGLSFNPSLYVDQPLNLTNRRSFPPPLANFDLSLSIAHSATSTSTPSNISVTSSSSNLISVTSASTSLLSMASPSTSLLPMPSPSASFFPMPSPSASLFPMPSPSASLFPMPSPSAGLFPMPSPSTGLFPMPSPSASLFPMPSPSANILPMLSPSANLFPMPSPSTNILPMLSPSANLLPMPSPSTNLLPTASSPMNLIPTSSSSANLIPMPSTSSGINPLRSSSANLPIGDPTSFQDIPNHSSKQNQAVDLLRIPGPSWAMPPPSAPQENPLGMSRGIKRQQSRPAIDDLAVNASESKKPKVARRGSKVSKKLLLTEAPIPHNNNVQLKVDDAVNYQGLEPEQPIKGVTLAPPPPGSRPISLLMKAKEKVGENDRKSARALKSKENFGDADSETAKQRNKPELFGDRDILELSISFADCPERSQFCDGNLKFQVPKIADTIEGQSELREALLRLFRNSNLPPVPSALTHSVHALSQYPLMQHIFNLYSQGVNLDSLKFGAYGLAFENIRLVELGEQRFNDILDRMSYLGDDDLLHCLVRSEKSGAVCGHVAREIGKIRRHSKNHYPDKKWVCVFCRVQMCDMTDLERHTATHTELKPFECPQCAKKFCQKVTLTQHMNKSHGQELTKWDAKSSYICRQDGCSFGQGEEIACLRHLQQHHSQSDYIKRKNQNKWPFNVLTDDAVKCVNEASS